MSALQGYRTYIVGLLMAVAPPAMTYLVGLDWTKIVGPNAALVIAGLLTIGLRTITTTPPGQSS